jgi:cystathionine beta-lyase/cystathionine gamma-synthase
MSLAPAHMIAALPSILANLPGEWKGTTFRNNNLLGRDGFCQRLSALILSKNGDAGNGTEFTADELVEVGNAEDYFRVSSNVSTLLELALSVQRGYPSVSQVFTFGSEAMPLLAVMLVSKGPVHLYTGDMVVSPFTPAQCELMGLIGCNLVVHAGNPVANGSDIVISMVECDTAACPFVDGFIFPNVLYIQNPARLVPNDVLTIRKRMTTPVTTPMALEMLQKMAGVPVTFNQKAASEADLNEFYTHLQVLSGVEPNPSCNPACFTAGLSAICSLWMTLVFQGGCDVVMASTAYGGSSQLTDLLADRSATFKKHTFDITGKADKTEAIRGCLNGLAVNAAALMPTTVLFVEIPTNPDMKIPNIAELAVVLENYEKNTGKKVLLLVDATFAPGSRVMHKMMSVAPDLSTMTFISMSKSISRGTTTAGTLVAGPSPHACELLQRVYATADMLDTRAKKDQLVFLCENHVGVEDRCRRAYDNAVTIGNALVESVRSHASGYDMSLAFVTPEQAADGFTTSTFSFNLPGLAGATTAQNEALAQKFVDFLTLHKEVKPCVSFGQDNGLVYATVPATSTQGAIKEEHKAKQAVGGVQLVRVSFSPGIDVAKVTEIFTSAVVGCYSA